MRTLIVYGHYHALHAAINPYRPDVHHAADHHLRTAMTPGGWIIQSLKDPGDAMQGVIVVSAGCLLKLRGLRSFDVVIEDPSFDLYKRPGVAELLWSAAGFPSGGEGSGDAWDMWRRFVRAHVLKA